MKFKRVEDELLTLLVRFHIGSEEYHTIENRLKQRIDWSYFLEIAQSHGVYTLIYSNLQKFSLNNLNETDAKLFKETYRNLVMRNLAYASELTVVLRELQSNDIPAIPIKGPVLAHLIYGDVSLRMINDLD